MSIGKQSQDLLGIGAREAFGMNGLTAFAFDDNIAEQQMLADADTSYALAHNDGFIVSDEFAFVVRHFIIFDDQFVRKNGISVAGYSTCLECVSHCGLNLNSLQRYKKNLTFPNFCIQKCQKMRFFTLLPYKI